MAERRLPPLRLLTVFEAVVRAGSLGRAAGELNITQPAVSQALKSLEDHVGAALLDRRTRPATLTTAGSILQAGVSEGLGRIAEALDRIRALQSQAGNAVTIACSVGTATYWLMPRLASFYALHPDIAVNVMTTPQGAPALTPGVDLALRYGAGRWKDGRVLRLFAERVVPLCSPALAARIAGPGWSSRAPLLHVDATEPSWIGWREFLAQTGLPESRVPGRTFTNYVQATQAALAGQGVMLGWQTVTPDFERDGRLVPAGDAMLIPEEGVYLVVAGAGGAPPRRAVAGVVDWLTGLCPAV